MVVRRWRERDREALAELATLTPESDPAGALLASLSVPAEQSAFDANPTLVVEDGGDLVGIGTLWENDIHPARWRVSMFGRPSFWSQGGAASLLAKLKKRRPDNRPLQTSISERDGHALAFFQANGFALLMRTRSGVLHPGDTPGSVAQDIDTATGWMAQEGLQIVPLPAFHNRPFSDIQLARLHAEIYAREHLWDPVRDLTGREAAELFLDPDEFLHDATCVAMASTHLVGVTSLRRTDRPGVVELGWTGSLLDDPQQRRYLAHALLGASLHHAASANWRVSFEIDEADAAMWEMVTRLPLDLDTDWLTFAETDAGSA